MLNATWLKPVEAPSTVVMPSAPSQGRERVGRQALGEVDLALAQGLDHGVFVAEDAEDQLVDLGRAGPVVLVGLEPEELPGLVLDEPERPGSHGLVVVGEGEGLVGGDVLPDVLGQDRHREAGHDRRRLADREDQGGVVGGLGRGDVGDVAAVVGLLIGAVDDPVEGVRGVLGGERLAVGPTEAGADLVGPRGLVGGLLPRLGQGRLGGQVLLRVPRSAGRTSGPTSRRPRGPCRRRG